MRDKRKIAELYDLYDFQKLEDSSNFLVFLYDYGYFKNLEVIYDKEDSLSKTELKTKYSAIGYNEPNYYKYTSIEELHERLFKGFFRLEQQKKEMEKNYQKFVKEKKESLLIAEYYYIPCSYSVDNGENNSTPLIDRLIQKLKTSKGFFILEAAAGYGKTCTIYELMNKMTKDVIPNVMPLFIELSKNRAARIFRYVLLSEIERVFHGLSSKLVLHEIKQGKIPLIIDGFDELLSNDDDMEDSNMEHPQTMLETLFELVGENSEAKIILTSRKTSLIANGIMEKLLEHNEITERFTILEPDLNKWLDENLLSFLKRKNIDLLKNANPILLTMLKTYENKDFNAIDFNLRKIIEEYLDNLLKREKDRQELLLKEDEQKSIFIQFTKFFVTQKISSDTPEYINLYFNEILSNNLIEESEKKEYPCLADIIDRYVSAETKPTPEQFIGKLSRHVLLDTSKKKIDQIGFINDFFFGFFINKVLEKYSDIELIESHIDKLSTAYMMMQTQEKEKLHKRLEKNLSRQKQEFIIQIDNQLIACLSRDYKNVQLGSMFFDSFDFSKQFSINAGIFSDCVFKKCYFAGNISESQFFNCRFFDCEYKYNNEFMNESSRNYFHSCEGLPQIEDSTSEEASFDEKTNSFEKRLLEQYWPSGKPKAEIRKLPKTLFKGFNSNEFKEVEKAIKNLKKNNFIKWSNKSYELNMEKITEIREKLGR